MAHKLHLRGDNEGLQTSKGMFWGTLIALLLYILFFLFIASNTGCDTAQANYRELYYKQVFITDSIKTVLMEQINTISTVANRKIDSLKTIETNQKATIAYLNNIIANFQCDSAAIIRYFNTTQLHPYLFVPLNQRLTEIIDSLNRR